MTGRLRLGLILLLLACPFGPALAERVALVVGAAAYRHVPALPNAANDATDMADSLRGLGFRVDLVLDPDRTALERAVERFGTAARGAEAALFFYAGHAIEVGGRNWLIPVSAELRSPQQLRFQALELEAVTEQTQQAARFSMVILDACRDNPFRQRWPAATRGIVGAGLARVSPASGTLVVFSTAPGEVAADGQGRNSPFTAAMLRHMPTPGLEVRPMLAEVRRSVREATRGAQVPWEESSLEGSFYFRPAAAPAAPPPAPVALPPVSAGPDRDALAWQFVLNSRNPADFEVFLQQFPNSVFAPFAQNRLAELRGGGDRGIRAAPPQVAALPVPPVPVPPAPPAPVPPPDPRRALTRAEAQEAQRLLTSMGFDTGGADGVFGPRSREALRGFAIAAGQPETLEPVAGTLDLLRAPPPPPERRAAALGSLARRALGAGDAAAAQRQAQAAVAIHPDPEARAVSSEAAARLAAIPVAVAAEPARPVPPAPAEPAALPATPAAPVGPVPFRCPPAGLRLVFADGSERLHLGTAPGDPETCLVAGRGGPSRWLFNLHELPVPNESALRRGLRALWPAEPGRGHDFIFQVFQPDGSSPTARSNWRVLRRDTLEVGGAARPVLVFERLFQQIENTGNFNQGSLSSGTETLWLDLATGAWLRRDQALTRGRFDDPPFRVVRIEQR